MQRPPQVGGLMDGGYGGAAVVIDMSGWIGGHREEEERKSQIFNLFYFIPCKITCIEI